MTRDFNAKVALSMVNHNIEWYGDFYTFTNVSVDEFNQLKPTEEKIVVKGLFHNGSADHVEFNISDNSGIATKTVPYLLVGYTQVKDIKIGSILCKPEDETIPKYRVTGISDLNDMHLIADISLEVIEDANYF